MTNVITSKTLHQLTDMELNLLLLKYKGSAKKKLNGQRSFEKAVISRGWFFADDYEYNGNSKKTSLICGSGHLCNIYSTSFKSGSGCPKCSGLCPEQAKEDFEKLVVDLGWSFSDDYLYVNNSTKVSLICDNKHSHSITPKNLKTGWRCPKCSGQCPIQAREQLEQKVQNRGWSFSDDYEYVNCTTKISLICDIGHHVTIIPNDFKSGTGCRKCSSRCPEQAKEDFEKLVVDLGWSFSDDYEYTGIDSTVLLFCDIDHPVFITPYHFKNRHQRCARCSGRSSIQAKINFEQLVKQLHWVFADDYSYVDTTTKVSLLCKNGHPHTITPNSFSSGSGCPKCSGLCPEQAKEDFEKLVVDLGWSFSDDYLYVNNSTKVSLVCNDGHSQMKVPNNLKNGMACASCSMRGFNPNLPAYLYLHEARYNGQLKGAKFGITNKSPDKRMNQQSNVSSFDHTMLRSVYSEEGQNIADLERYIKTSGIETHWLPKEDMPDGYTETVSPNDIQNVLKIMNNWDC